MGVNDDQEAENKLFEAFAQGYDLGQEYANKLFNKGVNDNEN